MILNFFDNLRDIIVQTFKNFNFSSFIVLLTGVILGFLVCASIYTVLLFTAMKKDEKISKEHLPEVDNEEIFKLIRSSKNEYIEESSGIGTGQKIEVVKNISFRLLNDIAKVYYPNSEYPIYELSIDEMLMLCHYITDRINSLFKGPVLKNIKKIKVSSILKIIDMKKKMDENKVVKAANKMKITKIAGSVMSVINVFNPVYWVKKLMINTTLVATSNKIALIIIDVVGEETNKVYSKSVFNTETSINMNIDESVKEIENLIESEK